MHLKPKDSGEFLLAKFDWEMGNRNLAYYSYTTDEERKTLTFEEFCNLFENEVGI